MNRFSKIVRPIVLAAVIAVPGAVGDAWAGTCDDDCPFDGGGALEYCYEPDIGPIECGYSDYHYYISFGGSC
ncbi:hypothetical protein [Candidatus Palauibacter sp.]|uniref:hypothetical protein n=1 Tax=Candidatus Palauibacter sp. TaxID=3101350 RepID=UPI003B58F038